MDRRPGSLDALAGELVAFRELMDERDKRYDLLDRANKEAIRAAFASAEKASEKTEAALKEYKIGANEWRDTVKDLIGNLRESRERGGGKDDALEVARATHKWMIGIGITLALAAAGMLVNLMR